MPFCIWNMRAAFQAVPTELEEAAFLDGATPLAAFWYVTMPLALPSLAVAFLAGYSEFALGWLFVESSKNVTLAMALWGVRQMGGAPWSQLAALAVLMCVPVLVLFAILQLYLIRGMGVGLVGNKRPPFANGQQVLYNSIGRRGVAQTGSAQRSGRWGRRFKSSRPDSRERLASWETSRSLF
jgi:ABC-type Fe3+ transport system permease subunit